MRTEKVLWSVAVLGALYLLAGPLLGGRTVWGNGGIVTDSAGWEWVMPVSGLVAIAGLGGGVLWRPRVVLAVLGAVAATIAFAFAAYAAGSFWIALLQGTTALEGVKSGKTTTFEVLYPARPQSFAVVAAVATGLALVLVISWLKPASDEW